MLNSAKAGVMQVIKIWLLLVIISMPNQPSVRYTAYIYPEEEKCLVAKDKYNTTYGEKPLEYKEKLKSKAFCIPFDSFPIKGLQFSTGA